MEEQTTSSHPLMNVGSQLVEDHDDDSETLHTTNDPLRAPSNKRDEEEYEIVHLDETKLIQSSSKIIVKKQKEINDFSEEERVNYEGPNVDYLQYVDYFKPIPKYVVNLDMEPKKRWRHIVMDLIEPLKLLTKYLQTMYEDDSDSFTPSMTDIISQIYTPDDLEQEMWGIADITDSFGMNYDLIYQFNVSYNDFGVNSSVAFSEFNQDGVFQLRHSNYEPNLAKILRLLTVDVDFIKNGKLIFKTTTFLPLVGVSNGLKFSQFSQRSSYSFSYSFRTVEEGFFGDVASWFGTILAFWNTEFLLREVFEKCEKFKDALEYIRTSRTISASYILLCSTDNAILITRGRSSEEKSLLLHKESTATDDGSIELETQARRRIIVQGDTDWFNKEGTKADLKKKQLAKYLFKHSPKTEIPNFMLEYSLACLSKKHVLTQGTIFQQVINTMDGTLFSRSYNPPVSSNSNPPYYVKK